VSDDQGQLFDPTRFSPLHLSVWVRLPGDRTRTLVIASAIGRSIRADSSFAPLRHGKDVIGVYVGLKDKATTLKVAEIHERDWRYAAECWERLNIAHRCGRGHVTPFVSAEQSPCPNPACGLDMPDVREPYERWGLRQPEPLSPDEGLRQSEPLYSGNENPSGEATRTPEFVPISGDSNRDETGDGDTLEEQTPNVTYGREESVCVCGHGFTLHWINGRCKRLSCDCQKPVRADEVRGNV
jgi:SpoVK/Ycf46/Vps4 family AAA+-type ATPase